MCRWKEEFRQKNVQNFVWNDDDDEALMNNLESTKSCENGRVQQVVLLKTADGEPFVS